MNQGTDVARSTTPLADGGRIGLLLIACALSQYCAVAQADHGRGDRRWLRLPVENEERWKREPRQCVDHWRRAGDPQGVHRFAKPSIDANYTGSYVGGGAVLLGRERDARQEGVWGVDYDGVIFPKRVFLDWNRGWRRQGGVKGYQTDGPHVKHTIHRALHQIGGDH